MPVTPFRAMEFKKNDVITKDAMDQMQANLQYIRDNTPRGRYYNRAGDPLDVKTLIVGGKVRIRKTNKIPQGTAKVKFGETFDPNCRPHITTAIISETEVKVHCVLNGPDGTNYPTATGFEVFVAPAEGEELSNKVTREFWISWQAFGFRKDDLNAF